MEPPMAERSSGGGLKAPCNLEKWNTLVFPYSTISLNFVRREEITL